MAETSRTILIDGNNSGAGWGAPTWLAQDSFFRTHFPDVEIIIDFTRNAVESVFRQHQIRIDYLHIDADHSFAGALGDFEAYRCLLHEGSVVTLHDTNCAGAGVKHVIEHIRTLSDCDVVDFPDIGQGTALVRIGKSVTASRFKSVILPPSSKGDRIRVTRHPDAVPLAPGPKEWKYLESEAFATRYALAAHWVRSCRSVIEIGGCQTPIDQFLTGNHDSVLVLDPFIREAQSDTLGENPCAVSHVHARFQDVDWHIPDDAEYGLVLLGLEIQGLEAHHYEVLYQLVNQAKVTVIEFPPCWAPSVEQFERIRKNTNTNVAMHIALDLDGNDFGDLSNSWPPRCRREMHLLVPR
jgi:hypothetical protein